jgi:general secretion pathway protein D
MSRCSRPDGPSSDLVILRIRPVIQGTETIELNIYAELSQVTGFAQTDPVPTPIVSKRSALTSVFLPNGQSVILGGLVSKTEFENESKIPFLGDIPLLGFLFRSTFSETTSSELFFHIKATIRQGLQPAESAGFLPPFSGGQ